VLIGKAGSWDARFGDTPKRGSQWSEQVH